MLFWTLYIGFYLAFPEDIKRIDVVDDKNWYWYKWKEEGWVIKIKQK